MYSSVPSVEPSDTTTTSTRCCGYVWAPMASSTRWSLASRLYVGMITVTVGSSPSAISHDPGHRVRFRDADLGAGRCFVEATLLVDAKARAEADTCRDAPAVGADGDETPLVDRARRRLLDDPRQLPEHESHRQGVAAPDVLRVEGAVADAIVLLGGRRIVKQTRAVVVDLHIRVEEHGEAGPIGPQREVEVLRRAKGSATAHRLVEPSHLLERVPAHRHVGAHTPDPEVPVVLMEP